jgi:type I restriction enzyme M protein
MRKSLGSKRNEMSQDDIAIITKCFGDFEIVDARELDKPAEQKSNRGRQSANPKTEAAKTFAAKIFKTHEFGYRRISIERPLRMSYQFSDAHIASLRFESGALNAVMQWAYTEYVTSWVSDDVFSTVDLKASSPNAFVGDPVSIAATASNILDSRLRGNDEVYMYGDLNSHQDAIRRYIKLHFADLKEKHIKDLLDRSTWQNQKAIMLKARQLQTAIGNTQFNDMNVYDDAITNAAKKLSLQLDAKDKKAIEAAVSWKNPEAEKVIKKIHKTKADPVYGLFAGEGEYAGKVLEYKFDSDLRDAENVALDPSKTVNDINEAYFKKEVQPHVPDAWIDASKKDDKDQQIGIVGYEIPFNRHFYQYQPPRDLAEIDADLDAVSAEIMKLLQEVHS